MSSKFLPAVLAVSIIASLFLSMQSWATPEYGDRSGQGCKTCHIDKEGSKLSIKGLEFAASGYVWPPENGHRVLFPIKKTVRIIIGSFHILSAFLWFGTILYVHILLRPAYAAHGLPIGEVAIGMISMSVVGISGILLTVSRIKSISILYTSPWGMVLSVKIICYLIMITSALFVVLVIGPKLKRGDGIPSKLKVDIFDPATLSAFDGKEGRPAYVAYKDKVYDVSALKLWKGGVHMKHSSGNDLTAFIARAPHGEEKLEGLNVVGTFDANKKPPRTFTLKVFYIIAYINLVIVLCVLLTIAYWRWGL